MTKVFIKVNAYNRSYSTKTGKDTVEDNRTFCCLVSVENIEMVTSEKYYFASDSFGYRTEYYTTIIQGKNVEGYPIVIVKETPEEVYDLIQEALSREKKNEESLKNREDL